MVDKVSNFGDWPPTAAFRDAFKANGILFNLTDGTPAQIARQIAGARSHDVFAGVWHPVPPSNDRGSMRAKWIHETIQKIDAELALLSATAAEPAFIRQGASMGKVDVVWLNLEGYTISQWKSFIWGDPPVLPGQSTKGWRGVDGAFGSAGGYRSGIATGVVDEPFKDGSVKPHKDFMAARFMLAVEGFYGPTASWPDMTPADHPQAMIDRIFGHRMDGTTHGDEAYPPEQVVGCYDAALGRVVGPPAEPLLIRSGLHFTLERAGQAGII